MHAGDPVPNPGAEFLCKKLYSLSLSLSIQVYKWEGLRGGIALERTGLPYTKDS